MFDTLLAKIFGTKNERELKKIRPLIAVINEHEPLLLRDLARLLRRIAPQDTYYEHNDFSRRTVNMNPGECANGHSHAQHLFLSTSETIPVMDGRLVIGTWQSVFLVELDHPRPRQVLVTVMGIPHPQE